MVTQAVRHWTAEVAAWPDEPAYPIPELDTAPPPVIPGRRARCRNGYIIAKDKSCCPKHDRHRP